MKDFRFMEPEIRNLEAVKFVGISDQMSLIEDRTFKLFSTFIPRRNEVINAISTSIFNLRVYDKDYLSL